VLGKEKNNHLVISGYYPLAFSLQFSLRSIRVILHSYASESRTNWPKDGLWNKDIRPCLRRKVCSDFSSSPPTDFWMWDVECGCHVMHIGRKTCANCAIKWPAMQMECPGAGHAARTQSVRLKAGLQGLPGLPGLVGLL